MERNAKINLKALYTNKVIALRKFEMYQDTCTDEQYYMLADNCSDTASHFEQGVERAVKSGATHPMEVIRHMAEWDRFIAQRINNKENQEFFKL